MKKFLVLSIAAASLALGTPANASGNTYCGQASGNWMSIDAVKAKAAGMGYNVRRVKREDGCYEVYAIGKNGGRVEIYMHPVTGKVVKIKNK